MNDIENTGINPAILSEFLTRALAIDQELHYRLESADMIEEARLVREQARCCLRSLAQVQNYFEASVYRDGKVRPTVFNLSELMEDIASAVRSRTRSIRIEITYDIEKGVFCLADPDRLSVCVVNLIVNALQNVDQDEGKIKISLKRQPDCANISVIDNGYGMTNGELSERLYRDGGSQGLDILRMFCESVGTKPLTETTENGGLSITVKVPLAPPSDVVELRADVEHIKTGTMAPYTLLIYKYDGASVIL